MSITLRPIRVSVFVPAAPDDVFGFISDTRNDPDWCPNVTDVVQLAGEGVAPGSRFRFHQSVELRGRRLVSDVEVEVIAVGDRTIEWIVDDRFQERHVRLSVEPVPAGSRVIQQTTATFKRKPGVARWVYPFLARRTFKDQFAHLTDRFARTS